MSRPMNLRLSSLLVFVALSCTGKTFGSPATDELLRYVPEDVGFCVVVQDLRGHHANLRASPFFQKWGTSFPGSDAERKQLGEFEKYVEKFLGVTSKDIVEDILGDAFAFAYRPGPAGKPGEEQGLFLVRARDPKKLARLIDSINKLQKSTGEIEELTEGTHRGVRFVARKEAKETTYYLLRGPVLLFTSQRPLLERAIDCDLDLAAKARPPLALRLERLRLDKALVALALNPRAWDSAMNAKTTAEGKAAAGYWKAVEGFGLGLSLDADIRLSLTLDAKVDRLGPAARRFLVAAGKPSPLWASFPDDALFAASGRLNASALYEMMSEFLPEARRKTFGEELERTVGAVLGKDVVKELLPALGPDWGVCVTAPPVGGKQWTPNALAAVRIAPGDDVDQAVLEAVQGGAQLAVLGHNKQHPGKPIALKKGRDKVRHLTGEGVFPPGVEPAFGQKAGYLVAATSPVGVVAFEPGAAGSSADVPLLRASFAKWRTYLAERREPIAAALASSEGLTKAKALERIDASRAALEAIDRVELRFSAKGDVAAFALTVTPALGLKK